MIVDDVLNTFNLKTGFEIHWQTLTNTKLFSYGPTPRNIDASNTWASYLDLALPGMLPVLNTECLKIALKASLALKGQMDRENGYGKFISNEV